MTMRPEQRSALVTSTEPTRRRRHAILVAPGAGSAPAALDVPHWAGAQAAPKIRIGFWPVAAGLPFFAAGEKGYFEEAGVDVEPLKFAGAAQVMEAMLSGRCDGSANGTGSANLAIGEIAQPGLFKVFATNPGNAKYVLEEFRVPGQHGQDDGRPEGQACRLRPRHPERDARQDDARAVGRRRGARTSSCGSRIICTWPAS